MKILIFINDAPYGTEKSHPSDMIKVILQKSGKINL